MNRFDIWMLMEAKKASLDEVDAQELKPKRLVSYLAAIGAGIITLVLMLG